ncbi:hypothetical protein SERLA73DRAFT_168758 [Serpula lacrymans var. lacrymans S7.3]|uniref:DH domain-containing protein n=2 Tax=Serpula lacrymans var. lacrymans TaxID=341189 RepID=F8PWS7_SERL3|nr:uncharacterized protein SERLADRAFT_449565 [Serpula lacrymans var. lacrymans S7.9]EGN99254.1 hypothetical protein SERLA73DRAFT_168758 [Serpula lacrymans var. lacrymans S7.3]EGO24819.1 hypothetical protein SERLADRAFT_449565 [Serpula lacrymans var. lacrymans S7.9]
MATMAFPEPEIHRAASQRKSLHPDHHVYPGHRSSKSDVGHSPPSIPPYSPTSPSSTLQSEEGLRHFQAGELAESDEEWYRLVPEEAREALGKHEVERQSVLFEVFKSERDYVSDMELVREVFTEPLQSASPPVIPQERLQGFVREVFWNLDQILSHHQRMLGSLFARQRDQHPLVQSVTDIILETSFQFRNEYESYIKHYPLAEEGHRAELKSNQKYQEFIQQCSHDPRIRKRDLITFLSRPVTRLPRLSLVLEHIHKLTDTEHPDFEDLPVIMSILSDFIKSTQPGIAAAENKVKFWNICESLVYMNGEIIDIDRYDESRSLVYSGPLARRSKSEMDWHGWNDLLVVLFDNYLLLLQEKKVGSMTKRYVVSRPLPLEFLRLGSFDAPLENRKERSEEGGLLDSFRAQSKPVYPFTVFHAASKGSRRYTLYAVSEAVRKKWRDAMVDAMGVHNARRDGNKWFAPQPLDDGFFRSIGGRTFLTGTKVTGAVTSAVSFVASGGRSFLAVGCATGIYVGPRGEGGYRKVLSLTSPSALIALQEYNKLVVHHDTYLVAYSLDLLVRVALKQTPPGSLDASLEKIAGHDGNVLFCKAGRLGTRTTIIYAVKTFLQVTVHIEEAINPGTLSAAPRRANDNGSLSFRPFGGPLYVPKDAYNVTPLTKMVAISTEKGIIIVNSTSPTKSGIVLVPDFSDAHNSKAMTDLKSRCEAAKPLGLVRSGASELLVIYDTMGCYITKHGVPCRSSGFVRWETSVTTFAQRGDHVLLFSSDFIEVRNISKGRLVQVIEGSDIRLLQHNSLSEDRTDDNLLVGMKGEKNDKEGISDKILELVETTEFNSLQAPSTANAVANVGGIWDEWDM